MLVQSPEGDMKVIDFRETAPAASTQNMFEKDKTASVTVPTREKNSFDEFYKTFT